MQVMHGSRGSACIVHGSRGSACIVHGNRGSAQYITVHGSRSRSGTLIA